MNRICAAAFRASRGSCRPMYWLVTTAPPVASALMIWIIRVLKLSTRLTPETAASPTEDTIRVSARPMVTLSACSAISGSSRAMSCCRVNSGGLWNVGVLVAVIGSSVTVTRYTWIHDLYHTAERAELQEMDTTNRRSCFISMEHRLVREPKAAPQRVCSALPVQVIVLK